MTFRATSQDLLLSSCTMCIKRLCPAVGPLHHHPLVTSNGSPGDNAERPGLGTEPNKGSPVSANVFFIKRDLDVCLDQKIEDLVVFRKRNDRAKRICLLLTSSGNPKQNSCLPEPQE